MTAQTEVKPKPKGGPNAKDPNSRTQYLIKRRTEDKLLPAQKMKRDRYIDGLLLGMTKMHAAMHAGSTGRTAAKDGSTWWGEPYVQQRYKELRDRIEEEQFVCRKDVILGLLREANREGAGSSHAARVGAWTQLSKTMGYDAPVKVQAEVLHRGGVMQVPMAADQLTWEKAALQSQHVLTHDSKDG